MKVKNTGALITLMVIGEFTFLLPFVILRIFRPTFLTVFGINNLELGTAFSFYGIVAMISYFAGGPIADRFSPRKLLSLAMIATALGGIVMMAIPSMYVMILLYGFWGMTTILLFWPGYVKAQRELGGVLSQGKSFGSVDAGRGFIAAIIASSSVYFLDVFLPVSAEEATLEELQYSLQIIIGVFTILTAAGALLICFFLKDKRFENNIVPHLTLSGVRAALKRKSVWMQAFIILCAYVGYKSTDDFSLFAKDTFGYNDVDAAHMATINFWIRPLAAIAAGYLGDKIIHSKIISWCFAVIIGGCLMLSSGLLNAESWLMIVITIASTSAAVYGLRGVYFALFQEAKLPVLFTGSATGIVSVIGYTPDVFMGPLMGVILDNNPGSVGHQYLFAVVAGFSLIGLGISIYFRRTIEKS